METLGFMLIQSSYDVFHAHVAIPAHVKDDIPGRSGFACGRAEDAQGLRFEDKVQVPAGFQCLWQIWGEPATREVTTKTSVKQLYLKRNI